MLGAAGRQAPKKPEWGFREGASARARPAPAPCSALPGVRTPLLVPGPLAWGTGSVVAPGTAAPGSSDGQRRENPGPQQGHWVEMLTESGHLRRQNPLVLSPHTVGAHGSQAERRTGWAQLPTPQRVSLADLSAPPPTLGPGRSPMHPGSAGSARWLCNGAPVHHAAQCWPVSCHPDCRPAQPSDRQGQLPGPATTAQRPARLLCQNLSPSCLKPQFSVL